MRSKLILVGGVPGSGKSTVGKQLAQKVGVFVDKDTVSQLFSEAMLCLLGSHKDDRESDIYLTHVRELEYEAMMAQAFENLKLGHSVVCSAPFLRELGDAAWLNKVELEAESMGAEVVKVWVGIDQTTALHRIATRGASRDNWKLSNWNTYVNELPPVPPACENLLIIDNSRKPKKPLFLQVEALIESINHRSTTAIYF